MGDNLELLKTVISQFPESDEEIQRLYLTSDSFREICQDLVLCLRSIDKMEDKKKKETEYQEEYKQLSDDLRRELCARINEERTK